MMSFSQTPVSVSLTNKNRRFLNLFTHTPVSYITISIEVEGIQGPQRISTGLNLFCLAAWIPPPILYQLIHRSPSKNIPDLFILLRKSPRENPRQNSIHRMCQLILSPWGQVLQRPRPKCQPDLPDPATAKSTALLTRALMEKIFFG